MSLFMEIFSRERLVNACSRLLLTMRRMALSDDAATLIKLVGTRSRTTHGPLFCLRRCARANKFLVGLGVVWWGVKTAMTDSRRDSRKSGNASDSKRRARRRSLDLNHISSNLKKNQVLIWERRHLLTKIVSQCITKVKKIARLKLSSTRLFSLYPTTTPTGGSKTRISA